MPLTKKGRKIMRNMKKEHGGKKGESIFYASRNKGTVKDVEKGRPKTAKKRSTRARKR